MEEAPAAAVVQAREEQVRTWMEAGRGRIKFWNCLAEGVPSLSIRRKRWKAQATVIWGVAGKASQV